MTGSGLAVWRGSPNHYNGRNGYAVDHITLHIMVGSLSGTDTCFRDPTFGAASHYGVGSDGLIYQWVDESNGSWADANMASDCSGVTIEHAGGLASIPVTEQEIEASARLCADIARRHGWTRLWHDGLNGNIYLHREIPGTDHYGCPDNTINGLPVDRVITRANQLLGSNTPLTTNQGDTDMPAKTDPINLPNGQKVTVEYALQAILNNQSALKKDLANMGKRLGPVDGYSFDYLPAILNNLNSLFALVGKSDGRPLTDAQIDRLADSLKTNLGEQVANELAKRLNN